MAKERIYEVTLTGLYSMLHHADNVQWSDDLSVMRAKLKQEKNSVAGDDRSPACSWVGYCYHDGEHVALPWENLSKCFMQGGAAVSTGKGPKTFKAQTQSGMRFLDEAWPMLVKGKKVPVSPIHALIKERDFEVHLSTVRNLGFSLDVRRAPVGTAKHVRVRPKFPPNWTATGRVAVFDDQLTAKVLTEIIEYAGLYKGIGDWRPSSPKSPGPYGTFKANVKEILA